MAEPMTHVSVELLMAFEDHRWDTTFVDIPLGIVYGGVEHDADIGYNREAIIDWAEENLVGQAQYRNVVCWQLYSIDEDQFQEHELAAGADEDHPSEMSGLAAEIVDIVQQPGPAEARRIEEKTAMPTLTKRELSEALEDGHEDCPVVVIADDPGPDYDNTGAGILRAGWEAGDPDDAEDLGICYIVVPGMRIANDEKEGKDKAGN